MRSRVLCSLRLPASLSDCCSSERPCLFRRSLEERLRKYFENDRSAQVHVPADKKGINYYPFRKDKNSITSGAA